MDEALAKSGDWPNVAVEAGSDPRSVMREHGVSEMSLRIAVHDMGERERALESLVRDMWRDGMCECDERGACAECEYHFPERMRELGIEVDDD